jgi:mono/diheme cytochrome c family protein
MAVKKNRDSLVCTCSIVIVLVAEIILFSVSNAQARDGQGGGAAAKSTFQARCAMCHGQDGAGSEVGKSMNVPDLRSPAVQKLPDAQLAQVIADGKGGMPAFKNSLSEDQIHALVAHIRSLHQKK